VEAQTIEEKETGRLEAFSDGVFAIAITLLVLELKVPELEAGASSAELLRALGHDWPSYLAYLISFLTILVMWVNHHRLFTLIRRCDSQMLYLNGLLLLLITTVPFPTRLLAEYLERSAARTAAAIYCGLYFVLAIAFNALWHYAARGQRLLGAAVTAQDSARITRAYIAGPLFYLAALLLSFISAYAGVAVCLGMAIFFAVMGSRR
jgi:uncharacterized membrane protein